MNSVVSTIFLALQYVVLMPITHFILPIFFFVKAVITHTLLIPCLLTLRLAIFGLVYLPLTPVLNLAKVNYDSDVPVEVFMFRLLRDLYPHFCFFLINLLHYLMVSIFLGTFVGIIAGLNMSLVSHILSLPESKPMSVKNTQTTPYLNALERRSAQIKKEFGDLNTSPVKLEPKEENNALSLQDPEVKKEPEGEEREDGPILSNSPVVKLEEVLTVRLKPFVRSSDAEMYEDDDGYSYMTFDIEEEPDAPIFPQIEQVETITEESDSEIASESETYMDSVAPVVSTVSTLTSTSTKHSAPEEVSEMDTPVKSETKVKPK